MSSPHLSMLKYEWGLNSGTRDHVIVFRLVTLVKDGPSAGFILYNHLYATWYLIRVHSLSKTNITVTAITFLWGQSQFLYWDIASCVLLALLLGFLQLCEKDFNCCNSPWLFSTLPVWRAFYQNIEKNKLKMLLNKIIFKYLQVQEEKFSPKTQLIKKNIG